MDCRSPIVLNLCPAPEANGLKDRRTCGGANDTNSNAAARAVFHLADPPSKSPFMLPLRSSRTVIRTPGSSLCCNQTTSRGLPRWDALKLSLVRVLIGTPRASSTFTMAECSLHWSVVWARKATDAVRSKASSFTLRIIRSSRGPQSYHGSLPQGGGKRDHAVSRAHALPPRRRHLPACDY